MTREVADSTETEDAPKSAVRKLTETVREGSDSRRGFLSKSALVGTGTLVLGSSGLVGNVAAHDGESSGDEGDAKTEMDGEMNESTPFALVEFRNQATAGDVVSVDSVVLSDGGFVAIHDTRLHDGQVIESVIGVTDYLPPGEHQDVPAQLFGVKGDNCDRERLEEDQVLIAMPHRNTNDSRSYDFVATEGEADGPYTRSGQAVVDPGFAVVTEDGTTDGQTSSMFATVDFENQDTDGTAVEVNSTVLSEDGFVAIHDLRLLEGKVSESVVGVTELLEPGVHQNVTAELFDVPGADFDGQTQLQKTQPLIAMPHRNTNDEPTYDFVSSGGEMDGPFLRAGKAVIDAGFAEVEDSS